MDTVFELNGLIKTSKLSDNGMLHPDYLMELWL